MHIVGEGPGETPSALRCLSYLVSSLLTDIKHLAKNQQAGTLSVPFEVSVRSVPCFYYTWIKPCYRKAPSGQASSLALD